MNSFITFLRVHGLRILVGLSGFTLLFFLLWFRLGSLTYGHAASIEVASRHIAQLGWHSLLHNPLNAPYIISQHVALHTGHDGVTSLRLITTFWAITAMVLFYYAARHWHSPRVAALATWLFISSSYFLHIARLATPEVMWLVGMVALLVVLAPNRNGRHTSWALPLLALILSLTLYIPGMVWLVGIGMLWQRTNIVEAWAASRAWWLRLVSALLGLGITTPLIHAFVKTPELLKAWAGLPESFNPPKLILNHFLGVPEHIFVRGAVDPVRWLGHMPLLSVFEIVMVIAGTYFYVTHLRTARTQLIVIFALLAWLIIGIGGVVSLALLVPIVYIVVATGIAYMLREWLRVFPHNPIARTLGIAVVMCAVLLTSIYQTRSYFIAWRYNSDTHHAYTERL